MSGSRGCLNFVHPDPHLDWGRPIPILAILTREPSPATSSLTGQCYVVLRPREDRPEPTGHTQFSCTLCFIKYIVIWCCRFVRLFYSDLLFAFCYRNELNSKAEGKCNMKDSRSTKQWNILCAYESRTLCTLDSSWNIIFMLPLLSWVDCIIKRL